MSLKMKIDELIAADLSVLCRGCLTSTGEMRNMVEWGLVDDFYKLTNIQVNTADSPSLLVCSQCEDFIYKSRAFEATCQESNILLKTAIEDRHAKEKQDSTMSLTPSKEASSSVQENILQTEWGKNGVTINITVSNMEEKFLLPCQHCSGIFVKRTDLLHHLKQQHNATKDFNIELKFYCHIANCNYNIKSAKKKYFSTKKLLKQHTLKVHSQKITCHECRLVFPNDSYFERHLKSCNYVYVCQICDTGHNTHERFMVHLLRKHPDLHKQYKDDKNCKKRGLECDVDTKKVKFGRNSESTAEKSDCLETVGSPSPKRSFATQTLESESQIQSDIDRNIKLEFICDSPKRSSATQTLELEAQIQNDVDKSFKLEKLEFLCDSPKRSFATQTLELEKHIKNDVTLPSWQAEKSDETKTDEMSTQTVYEDLLSLKSNISDDYAIFADSVSLSDIQTQTFPFEFGLSRSNKETVTSETQSPDLSIKETQTCLCLYDSVKANSLKIDSPGAFNALTSTETQTLDFRGSFYNDLLTFTSAETQTSFDNDCKDM